MEIAIGTEWRHKDGAIVEVSDVVLWKDAFYVIEYKFEDNQCGVATRVDFLDSFKPLVYEYQCYRLLHGKAYMIKSSKSVQDDRLYFYTEKEMAEMICGVIVKIEETKRERKC